MKKSLITTVFVFLLLTITLPTFLMNNAKATDNEEISNIDIEHDEQWFKIKTDLITIMFPAGGKKPMFLWWYANDTNNIYIVKYKGLIEYMTLDYPYYLHKYQAEHATIQEKLETKYAGAGPHCMQIQQRIRAQILAKMLGFRPAFLPFSACQWNLTGPVNVTREDGVRYISFNFTLVEAHPPKFSFANGNIIIRARFYETDATETAYGLYNYTVHAGELKMDIVIKKWEWNIDILKELFDELHDEFGITVPQMRAGLALWTDLASINITDVITASQDANSSSDVLEGSYRSSDIIVGGRRVGVRENKAALGSDETPIQNRIRERFRLQFATGSQTLAGFFDFVDKAVIIDQTTGIPTLANVTAAYIAAGAHMRVYIGYPYFGNNTLEHDPTIGVENVAPWLPINLLMVLVGATVLIAVAVAAVKMHRKTINIVNVH